MRAILENDSSRCPGFFRLREAQDGKLCRIKLPLGHLLPSQLYIIGQCAQLYGNDHVELTIRGNIQLRGIKEKNRNALLEKLLKHGLGPLHEKGDDIRNIMVSPSAGFDSFAYISTLKLAHQILREVQINPKYQNFSPKFSILIQGGEKTENSYHISDIWLSACKDKKHYALGLASCPKGAQNRILGIVPENKAFATLLICLNLFDEWRQRDTNLARMKDIFNKIYGQKFKEELKAALPYLLPFKQEYLIRNFPDSDNILYRQNEKGRYYIEVRPPLGRLNSTLIKSFLNILQAENLNKIRISPAQSFLIYDCEAHKALLCAEKLYALGWAVFPNDPYSRLSCCVGMPFCSSALSDVQKDAHYLAAQLKKDNNASIHLSACAKNCALQKKCDTQLIAQDNGRYMLKNEQGTLIKENICLNHALNFLNRALC